MMYNEQPQPEITQINNEKPEERDLARDVNVQNGYDEDIYSRHIIHRVPMQPPHPTLQ